MKEYLIGPGDEGIRLDKQLNKILDNAAPGFIYKMLRKKNITLNDKKASGNEHLVSGDIIKIFLSDETFEKFSKGDKACLPERNGDASETGFSVNDNIIYEDDDVLLVNKPAGLLSQKAAPGDISINELCLSYLKDKGELKEKSLKLFKPSICNRLDRNTSGLIIFAKTYKASALFARALKERTIHKYYLTVVGGRIDKEDRVSAYLIKEGRLNRVSLSDVPQDGASFIDTAYRPLACSGSYTLLEVELITGKSHQIRAQMAYLDHPLIGDDKYGDRDLNRKIKKRFEISSQVLHAYKLVIPDKKKTDLDRFAGTYIAPIPKDMEDLIKGLFDLDIKELN